jgi:RNA polymerase sigma factor (sigma-70 family)
MFALDPLHLGSACARQSNVPSSHHIASGSMIDSERQTTATSSCFPATQWTQVINVIQEGNEAAAWAALAQFCEQYRPAIYNFFRRRGSSHEEAEDYTQAFFSGRIVEHWEKRDGFLQTAQRGGTTRFRSFLCHVLWRFLQDEWKKRSSIRAGGGVKHVPLDELELACDGAEGEAFKRFGREFDQTFAREILCRSAERSRHSSHLLAHLRGEITQEEAAQQLGLTANAFKQAYHRFRQRLAADLREEVRNLVGPDQQEVRAEIEYLMSLFMEQDP